MAYELTPGETIQRYPLGVPGEPYNDLMIGTGNGGIEEYVDESGKTVERWVAALWVGNEQCHPALAHIVHTGDTVEFGGYRIRILDISSDNIVVAISQAASTPTRCELSPYNTVPGETLRWIGLGSSLLTESIEFYAGSPRIEERADENGKMVEEWAVEVRLSSEQISQIWEGTVHVGDSIEFGGYRIRILGIDKTSLDIAYGPLDKLQSTPER